MNILGAATWNQGGLIDTITATILAMILSVESFFVRDGNNSIPPFRNEHL